MILIFLYGYPGVGKLTVARELAKITDFRVFHNHLTVDLLLSVFEFGSPEFVQLRDRIWIDTMTAAARSELPGLIFTFCPESSVPRDFIVRLKDRLASLGAEISFINLFCPDNILKDRIANSSRREFRKLQNFEVFEKGKKDGYYDFPVLPESAITIDNSNLSAYQVAQQIKSTISKL
jgi:hypothetical protein